LDIKDLYVNIPIDKAINTTKTQLAKNNNSKTTNQITSLLDTTLKQNSFKFQDQIYQPDTGAAMGSPISGTIAKVFLHHLEEAHIKHLLNTNRITFYNRYADDILIIYDSTRTTYESILQYTNGIHNNMQLEPTTETNSRINYLYLLITRNPTKFGISIFRKPTSTDTTINFYSNNPLEHKLAAYRFHIERMFTLPLREAERQEEWESIKQIACNNNYPINLLQKLKQRIQ